MRAAVRGLALLVAVSAAGAPPPTGERLEWKPGTGGQPAVGLSYAYDVESLWQLTYSTTLSAAKLAKMPPRVAWSLRTRDGDLVLPWREVDRSMLVTGQLRLNGIAEVRPVLARLRSLVVQFARRPGGATEYWLDIADLCARLPTHVKDLTSETAPPCEPALD